MAEPTERSGPARVVVLASGNGSNLQAVLDACDSGALDARVVGVVSDRPDAGALARARTAGTPSALLEATADESRTSYDDRLGELVGAYAPDLVVLAGWMRLLSHRFLDLFPGQVINLHPALPAEYPGTDAIRRAFTDARRGRRDHTGVMVHHVLDEGVDDGPVIVSERVPILPDDDLDALSARVHDVEHRLLVAAIAVWTAHRLPSHRTTEEPHEPHR